MQMAKGVTYVVEWALALVKNNVKQYVKCDVKLKLYSHNQCRHFSTIGN